MKFSISTTLVLLLTLLTAQASPSSTNEGLFIRSATQEIDRIAREDGFSGTVLFARNGISILRIAEGLQDRQRQLPNRIDTKFPIESDTKQFTAAAILLLEQEGRLKLTDSISVYYPDMPPALVPITIAQLLTHSSGIVDCKSCGDADFLGYKDYVATSLQTNLAFQPGTGMLYSNAGYGLLAIAIEKSRG